MRVLFASSVGAFAPGRFFSIALNSAQLRKVSQKQHYQKRHEKSIYTIADMFAFSIGIFTKNRQQTSHHNLLGSRCVRDVRTNN